MSLTDEQFYADMNYYTGSTAPSRIVIPEKLLIALETAIESRSKIIPLQEDLRVLVDAAENDIERSARLYQIDLIEWQITRAADLAELRYAHLKKIKTQSHVDAEIKLIESDIKHFFKYYAWGRDPRPDSPLNNVPFELFEFQERYVAWLEHLVFTKRSSGVVEKARDMGATETALRWALHKWLFMPGFSAILLSANEDLVDSRENENTLFEKVREQLRMFPSWLLPNGFDLARDMPFMKIKNVEKGSAFHGYAPTANVGRQSRATVVLMDEYAAFQFGGFPQHTALSATAKSLIPISSVQGKNNKFADLCLDGRTAKFTMDWREHPWKDDRVYNSLGFGYIQSAMTEVEVAQEWDRNFDASQPGKVFTNLKEEYCFITWAELLAYYAQHNLEAEFRTVDGLVKIPGLWNWGRTFDWGQTPGHKWAYMIMARPAETFPLFDSVFVFCGQPMPQDGTTEQQFVAQSRRWETTLGLRTDTNLFINYPQYSECSHEQKDLRETLQLNYGESWTAWDTDYHSGLSQIREWFSIIDQNKPNPFRPNLNGRSTVYFVAPDNEYLCAFNAQEGKHFVTPSQTQWGFKLLREELGEYHYPQEERFKPLPAQRPAKKKDDVIDTLRGHAVHWGAIAEPLSAKQKYQKRLTAMLPPPKQPVENPGWAPDITAQIVEARLKKEIREEGGFVASGPFDDEEESYENDYIAGW